MKTVYFIFSFAVLLVSNCHARDLSNWMAEQSSIISDLELTRIALPGTHDTLTYSLQKEGKGKLGKLAKIPLVGSSIIKIAKAQGDDMIGQFNNGARYFDLRIEETGKGYEGVHGLRNGPIDQSFRDLKAHLDKHSGEIIFLDFQSVKVSNPEDLLNLMKEIFGELVLPQRNNSLSATYGSVIAQGKRVIIFMKKSDTFDSEGIAFDRKAWLRSRWHNESDPKKLNESIIAYYEKNPRNFSKMEVVQAQTTPDTQSVIKNVIKGFIPFKKSGLKGDAAKSEKYQNKLLEDENLLPAINVFMVDHLTSTMSGKIIDLNDIKKKAKEAGEVY